MALNLPPPSPVAGDGVGSASAIVFGGASGHHVLRIKGYSRTKSAVPNGKYVESRPFRVAGHTWAIKYYPNGERAEAADCVSFYLCLKDPVSDAIVVQFAFTFGDEVVVRQTPPYIVSAVAASPVCRFVTNSSWGTKDMKRENLEKGCRIKEDSFTIRCDIAVIDPPIAEDAASSFVVPPPPDWPQHFRALLHSGKGADVSFLVGGETFTAHRCVLAARSPVFDALLFGPMKEGTAATENGIIRIDHMEPQVFQSLLHFIYTDSLPETKGEDNGAAGAAMAQHLLEAADRYGMERLKLICEDRLCRHIDVSTVATTLALADQHRCQGLKDACFEFLKSSKALGDVMGTDGFQHLAKSCPSALFELMSKLAEH